MNIILAPAIAAAPQKPTVTAEGLRLKAELLDKAGKLGPITTLELRDATTAVAATIKTHLNAIEESYKEVAGPFYQMWKALGEAKSAHVKALTDELSRLNLRIGQYNEAERRRLQEEQEALRREQRRLAAEEAQRVRDAELAAEALRKEQEALALKQKQAQEALEAKGKGPTAKQRADALQAQLDLEEKEAQLKADQEDFRLAQEKKRQEVEEEQMQAAERLRQSRGTGGSNRTKIEIEVKDIHALQKAYPACVRMEPDLNALKFLINTHAGDTDFTIPGVTFYRTAVFATKAK
jgi:DNA repair exonuclease SbcCD ATPase subunit